MKEKPIFSRLLAYVFKYKKRFYTGVLFAFLLSLFNALSLAALKPVFDVLGSGFEKPFQIHLSNPEFRGLATGDKSAQLQELMKHSMYDDKREWLNGKIERLQDREQGSGLSGFYSKIKLIMNLFFIEYEPFDLMVMVALLILPLYFFKLLASLASVYFISTTGLLAVRDVRKDLYDKMITLPIHHFVQEKTGEWISKVVNDVKLLSDTIANDLRVSITNFFIVFTHLILLILINYKLLLISIIGVPLVIYPINLIARKIRKYTKREQTGTGDLSSHLHEMISGIRVIRAFGMEDFEKSRFYKINHTLYKNVAKFRLLKTVGPSLIEFASSGIMVGLIIYGGYLITQGKFTSGNFFTFLVTLMVILNPIKQLANWYNLYSRITAAGERVFNLADQMSEIDDPEEPKYIKKLKKSVKYQDVTFNYPNTKTKVLKKLSIEIPQGSTIALVGASGAGKSTFVDLLSRFYDPTSGSISIDDIDIRQMPLKHLREKIGIVTQEIFLFNTTLRENIAYGRDDISEEVIIKKSKMAYAHEFIQKLPEGYDTVIGERGMILSGGQRQRISIARALLKNPEILILDEATSALDTESERLVQKALERLMANRTTFVIAHRLSTIYKADLILVFDNGKIIEQGTHKSLLKNKGTYKKLYDLQFQG
ncbi:MAG: ABC transporter ATP-binding protein [Leptospirales bacterium]